MVKHKKLNLLRPRVLRETRAFKEFRGLLAQKATRATKVSRVSKAPRETLVRPVRLVYMFLIVVNP
jgi:hypothetical protein